MKRHPICLAGYPWQCEVNSFTPCSLSSSRFTLFTESFAIFRSHYLFAIGLPHLYLTLADEYQPIHIAISNNATPYYLGMRLQVVLGAVWAITYYGLTLSWKSFAALYSLCVFMLCPPWYQPCFRYHHNSRLLKPDSVLSSIPVRSPLTMGITVVFFSSAE